MTFLSANTIGQVVEHLVNLTGLPRLYVGKRVAGITSSMTAQHFNSEAGTLTYEGATWVEHILMHDVLDGIAGREAEAFRSLAERMIPDELEAVLHQLGYVITRMDPAPVVAYTGAPAGALGRTMPGVTAKQFPTGSVPPESVWAGSVSSMVPEAPAEPAAMEATAPTTSSTEPGQ